MTPRNKTELASRLKRIAGQVAGIQRMLDEDRPLPDVVTQLSAVRAALASVNNMVLASHVEARAAAVLASDRPDERLTFVTELVRLFDRRGRE